MSSFSHNGLDVWTIPEHNGSTGFTVYPVTVTVYCLYSVAPRPKS